MCGMRVLMIEAPQAMLDERRRRGEDRRDEMWDGLPHLQPVLDRAHQELATAFLRAADPVSEAAGLRIGQHPRLFRSADDYRVPDQAVYRPEQMSERGLESAELVIEIRQDWDQTYEKLDFYARVGVEEVLVLHPQPRGVELLLERGGRMLPVQSDGRLHSDVLGMWLQIEGDELVLTWDGGSARI
jgi:hypothetical protein